MAERCGARSRSGKTCKMAAGWHTPHLGSGRCAHHGGATPSHIIKAQREAAAAAVDTFGLPRDIAPAKALLEEIARTAGHVDWLAAVIRATEPDDLVWGVSKSESDLMAEEGTESDEDGEQPVVASITETAGASVWMRLYQWERRHLTEVSKTAIAAGIAERQVKLAEQHGHLIADVLRKVLADPELGLTDEQRKAVPAVARRHLAVVA